MAKTIRIADTIIDSPAFNDFPVYSAAAGDVLQGGRIMASHPHVDGLYICGVDSVAKDSANLALTRNAVGDWSLNRIAAGAETYNVRTYLDTILRTGETYVLDLFGDQTKQTYAPSAPAKGVAITDFFVISKAGVVALTSATLRLGKTVYSLTAAAPGGASVQTDLVAATGVQTATAANYVYQKVAGPTNLTFSVDDLGMVEIEYRFVMANTGTVQVAALGCHCTFNYN